MRIRRRQFLRGSAALAAAAVAAPIAHRALAAPPARKLVIVLASGGWDPTYVFDPKPGSTEIDAAEGQVESHGDVPILGHPSRPSVTEFFSRYASLCAVVNGVQVRSFVHSDCMKRVLTGTPSDRNADFGALTASVLGADMPVPYLVLGNSALSGPLAASSGRAGTTNQLASLLAPPTAYDPFIPRSPYDPDDTEGALIDRYLVDGAAAFRTERGRGPNGKELDAFIRSLERQKLLRRFAAEQGGFGEREYTQDLGVQIEVALSALSGQLCQCAMLEIGDWDTHQDNARQSEKFEALFADLVVLTAGLEERRLLDDTVVVVLSEMGRTPKLNESLGKDHWPVTSALVLGAGVSGGRVLGETDALLGARSIDLGTGAPSGATKQLQTGNFVAGVLTLLGVDPEPFLPDSEPFDALLA